SGDGVPPAPSGSIQAQLQAPLSVVAGQAFSLDARSSTPGQSGGTLKYFWDMSTAKAATAQIGHVYDEPGSYNVTLRIENERGEVSTTTQRIAVSAAPSTGMGTVSILVSGRNGEAVPNAQVAIAGQTLTTDASGALDVGSVPIGPAFVARVTKAGFAPSIIRGRFAQGASEFTLAVLLTATDTPATVDLAQAIDESNNGLRLRIPAGSLADANGNLATGMATVYINSDPSNTLTYGIKHGTEMLLPNGSTTLANGIKPFDIVIMQGNVRLNLLPGKTAQLDWDMAPTAAGDPLPDGTQLVMRTLDENSGLWRQEGVATVVSPPGGDRSIRATVGHFSYWDPTVPGSSDLILVIPSCEINIEGGLPVLNTGGVAPYCSFIVHYETPNSIFYPNWIGGTCWPGSFLQECILPRGTAYKVIARLGLDANTVLVQEQSFVANTDRPVVRFAANSLRPINPEAITISAKGGNVVGGRLYANGEVELKANFRSRTNFDGDVQFITGANDLSWVQHLCVRPLLF
ncbi:MAG: PKD domain-containing protein, partial [Brachymonas sp.]|nr:PKD domain-containing protein [Brachymonas sp.]